MRVSRDCLDLAINTRSSAKRRAEMLMEPRSIPKPDALSSGPSELMKRLKRRGDKLQPIFWNKFKFRFLKINLLRNHSFTLFYTFCQPKTVSVFIVDIELQRVVVIHGLYDA